MNDVAYRPLYAGPSAMAKLPKEDSLAIPDYLSKTYTWAYLSPRWMQFLDHFCVVQAILWGNASRLMRQAVLEFEPGQRVLQPASVYGDFSTRLSRQLGPDGHLEVADVAPIQVGLCRRKLGGLANVGVHRADASVTGSDTYDGVCCFFLLHEVPEAYKRRIVDALLQAVTPGGKVVFVDYHRPHRFHPLRPVMWAVFRFFEPFAVNLLDNEIRDLAVDADAFEWHKQSYFGGLYQKVVARRR
ncbi:MAG: rhodoquinone biosynthesis methyltransferase RquA [Allorhizobium sp.]